MTDAVRFSIVTVTFNNIEGLKKTWRSVLQQTFGNFEWIVIDGGSKDQTRDWVSALTDPRVVWISEPDRGIFDAMNKGIALSRMEYCIFMNAGDSFASSDVLSKVATLGSAYDVIYGDTFEESGSQRYFKRARNPRFNVYSMFTHHQSIFYRRTLLGDGYDLRYQFSGDWAMTSRLIADPQVRSIHAGLVVSCFERGGVSQQSTYRSRINEEHWQILRNEARQGLATSMLLWFVKTRVNVIRRHLPKLYDFVRFRPSS